MQVYAPTSAAEEDDVSSFYYQLNQTLSEISKKDVTIVMGDFNSKVGLGAEADIVGKYGLGK